MVDAVYIYILYNYHILLLHVNLNFQARTFSYFENYHSPPVLDECLVHNSIVVVDNFFLGVNDKHFKYKVLIIIIIPFHFLQYSYETLFRSQHFALLDNACREYLFLCDFFLVSGAQAVKLFVSVMGKVITIFNVSFHLFGLFTKILSLNKFKKSLERQIEFLCLM